MNVYVFKHKCVPVSILGHILIKLMQVPADYQE